MGGNWDLIVSPILLNGAHCGAVDTAVSKGFCLFSTVVAAVSRLE